MSALVSSIGASFVTETGARSGALVGSYLTETVAAGGGFVDLVGNLTVSTVLGADVSDVFNLVGELTPAVSFGGDLTVAGAPANYVDLAGNLGGVSLYGRRKYGVGKYSRYGAIEPAFIASALDIVGTDELVGDLPYTVSFAATTLTLLAGLPAGNITPSVVFNGDLGIDQYMVGNLTPIVDFAGELSFDWLIEGDLPFTVVFAGGELTAGPLWAETDPCPVMPWEDVEPCPTPPWVDAAPCPVSAWGSTAPTPPTIWTPVDPCDVEWEDSELCNG